MGTRSLTLVKLNGKFSVAQYSHWDGYPDGQGLHVLNFSRKLQDDKILSKFKFVIENQLQLIDRNRADEELRKLGYKISEDDCAFRAWETTKQINANHPNLSLETGDVILDYILSRSGDLNDKIMMIDSSSFIGQIDCAWVWFIDLDTMSFGGFSCRYNNFGLNDIPVIDGKKSKSYSISSLPDQESFLLYFS